MRREHRWSIIGLLVLLLILALSIPLLAANRDPQLKEGRIISFLVEDDVHIYAGALVCVNAAGYLVPGDDAANYVFVGTAMQEIDNTIDPHSQGGKRCQVQVGGNVMAAKATAAQTDVNNDCYVLDDQTVGLVGASTHKVYAGTITSRESSSRLRFQQRLAEHVPDSTYHVYGAFCIHVNLVSIAAAGDVVTEWIPGFAGEIVNVKWIQMTPVTTASKAADLNLEIETINVTGGVVSLTSATCTPLGKVIDGTAVTAANAFTATQKLSVEAATVTAFSEGDGMLMIVYRQHLQT